VNKPSVPISGDGELVARGPQLEALPKMNVTSESLYLSVDQVAKRFGVSKDSIWRWKRDGEFPVSYKLGGRTARWRLSDIEEWEAQRSCGFITSVIF